MIEIKKYFANENLEDNLCKTRKAIVINISINIIVITTMVISLGNLFGISVYLFPFLIPLAIAVMCSPTLFTIKKHAHMIKAVIITNKQVEVVTPAFFWEKEQTIIIGRDEMLTEKITLSLCTNADRGMKIKKGKKLVGYVMDYFFEDYQELCAELKVKQE